MQTAFVSNTNSIIFDTDRNIEFGKHYHNTIKEGTTQDRREEKHAVNRRLCDAWAEDKLLVG